MRSTILKSSPDAGEAAFDVSATNLVKGLAVCLLVAYHIVGAEALAVLRPLLPALADFLRRYGGMCVSFFVLLTGYGFGVKHANAPGASYGEQIVPRVVRLYKGYWAVFLPALLLAPPLTGFRITWSGVYGAVPLDAAQHLLLNFLGLSHLVYGGNVATLCQTWWYVSLALTAILLLPLICRLWRRLGWWLLLIAASLAYIVVDIPYLEYLTAAVLGVCLAGSDGFMAVHRTLRGPLGVLVRTAALAGLLALWYCLRRQVVHGVLWDSLAAWAMAQYAFDVLRPIPGLGRFLTWLGKHSGNVFYMHSLVISVVSGFAAQLAGVWICAAWAAVMAVTLIASAVLERLKELTRYNALFTRLEKKLLDSLKT